MIFKNISLCIALMFFISACQQTAKKEMDVTNSYVQVTNDNISGLIGKKLSLNNNNIALSDDGTLSGTWGEHQ